MIDPKEHINFHSIEWKVIKEYLKQLEEIRVGRLISETSHDESNRIRGSLQLLRDLLRLETAAKGPQRD